MATSPHSVNTMPRPKPSRLAITTPTSIAPRWRSRSSCAKVHRHSRTIKIAAVAPWTGPPATPRRPARIHPSAPSFDRIVLSVPAMRHATPVTALAALLIASAALAKPPAAQPNPSRPPASASSAAASDEARISPADRKRMQAVRQYQQDLVSVVALRADPDYLLGAAILAKPFKNPTQGLDFDALSQRAAAAPKAGAPAEWARLDACKSEKDCPNAQAFAWLKQHAADNAAVWMVALDVAARDKDDKRSEERRVGKECRSRWSAYH